MRVSVPWAAWYENTRLTMEFPENWDIYVANIQSRTDLKTAEIEQAIMAPLDSRPLREVALGGKTAAIAIDDISRPTPSSRILPLVLRELSLAGIQPEQVQVLLATGAHRPMTRQDMIKKVGEECYHALDIYNHNPYEDCVSLGRTLRGTPIQINRKFVEADVKVCISCTMPHPGAGFGGGAKLVMPGLGGIAAIEANHRLIGSNTSHENYPESNETRADMEEAARAVGVDFSVNIVPNGEGGMAGIAAGGLTAAFRSCVDIAGKALATRVPWTDLEFGIFNLYPKDTELLQSGNAFNVCLTAPNNIIQEDGLVIVTTACSEGRGFHSLIGPDRKLPWKLDSAPYVLKFLQGKKLLIYSPNLTQMDVRYFTDRGVLVQEWRDVVDYIRGYGTGSYRRGVVFPCASIQKYAP